MNDDEEIKRKILRAFARQQRPNFFSKKRLIFSAIASLLLIFMLGRCQTPSSQKKTSANTNNRAHPFNFPMSFCGDRTAGGTNTWYPVYVSYTQANLRKIRRYYCCDAKYDPSSGRILVASFYNRSKANKLVAALRSRNFSAIMGRGKIVTTTKTRAINNCK